MKECNHCGQLSCIKVALDDSILMKCKPVFHDISQSFSKVTLIHRVQIQRSRWLLL